MRVIAEAVESKDLQPGDLYSEHDQEWWDNRDSVSIGHFVIIRNRNPFPEGYKGSVSYKITIDQDDLPSDEEIDQFQVDDTAEEALRDQALDKEHRFSQEPESQEEASDDTTLITG